MPVTPTPSSRSIPHPARPGPDLLHRARRGLCSRGPPGTAPPPGPETQGLSLPGLPGVSTYGLSACSARETSRRGASRADPPGARWLSGHLGPSRPGLGHPSNVPPPIRVATGGGLRCPDATLPPFRGNSTLPRPLWPGSWTRGSAPSPPHAHTHHPPVPPPWLGRRQRFPVQGWN